MIFLKKSNKKPDRKPKLGKKGGNKPENLPEQDSDLTAQQDLRRLKKKEKVKVKKEKDDTYILKKNTGMAVLRVVFWMMLIFVFARGFYQIVKPDKISEIETIIQNFEESQKKIGDTPEEVMKFAQDFAKEYLTYNINGESEFKERIKPYVSNRIYNTSAIYSFKNAAKAAYVDAYKKELYAEGQYDVYVTAEVEYQITLETGEKETKLDNCTLKVPVIVTDNGFCVESVPMFVVDETRRDETYNPAESSFGISINAQEITPALTNFLDAYYAQDQSMINYLLTTSADKSKFIGLNKRYIFQKLENVTAYMTNGDKEIICMVKVKIQDSINSEIVYQEFNIRMVKNGDKYYIQDMDSRVSGVK